MKRWFPYPLLWTLLLAMWLLLNQTLAASHVLLGALVALGGTLALSALGVPRGRLRRLGAVAGLGCLVLADIVRSNIAVARIVLHPGTRDATSGFVEIPLELRHPLGLTMLAYIVTATPGTAWARYDSARGVLTLHVLDLIEEQTLIRTIKDRYERRLLEIFQ